ncbi:MAG: phosphopyruvate hydratase, partial [Eubacteriales bacterium]
NILNGGAHAENTLDIQEFMIMPIEISSYKEGLRICCEIYHTLKDILKENSLSIAVGDEGGFAPNLPDTQEALKFIVEAIVKAGYQPGGQIAIALDVAASEFYNAKTQLYEFHGESKMRGQKVTRTAEAMIDFYEDLIAKFPIVSIEDPLDENDWSGWELLTTRLGRDIQLVGDDLFVTNVDRLEKGIKTNVANAILVKVNQIGTLTESMNAIAMAQKAGYNAIVSHRSGETEDTFIADLAVAFCTGQIKTGAPCRAERTAKYNQLLRIEEQLSILGVYENPFQE